MNPRDRGGNYRESIIKKSKCICRMSNRWYDPPTRISHLLKLGVRKIQYADNNQLPGRGILSDSDNKLQTSAIVQFEYRKHG